MNPRKLKPDLEKKKNKIGLAGIRLELNETPGDSFSAHITQDFKTIALNYGSDLDLAPDEKTKKYIEDRKIENPELKLGLDILEHETGHRENPRGTKLGCPYIPEIHDYIKSEVTRALTEKNKSGLDDYVTNAFEDIIDNINCRNNTDYAGQTLFWNNQGLVNAENNVYGPFYEAFVKLNLILSGNIQDYHLLKRFFSQDDKVRTSVKEFTDYLKSKLNTQNLVKLHEKQEFDILFNKNLEERSELLGDMAYNFTISMADLLEDIPKEKMFGLEGENPFDKEMKTPKAKQEIAFKRYKQGKGPAFHRDRKEQLYDLYKKLSKEILVETSHYEEGVSMPLVHFGRRFIKEDERKFRFKGIGVKEDGDIGIKTTRYSQDFPVSYKIHPTRFPRLKIAIMDRSGSMKESPNGGGNVGNTDFIPWGDNSKYHFALKGYVGIDNFFERQGILNYIENCVLGLSGENIIRGNSRDVIMDLLETPSGGTSLNVDQLINEITPGSFLVSISDGEFSISDDEKEKLPKKLEEADYAHIQVGKETKYSKFLNQIGVPVFPTRGDDDLSRVMVSFVSGYYRGKGK